MTETENPNPPATTNGVAGAEPSNVDRTDQNDKYSLHVKPEFILKERAPSLGPIPDERARQEPDARDKPDNSRQSGKKRRNQKNTKRPRDERQDDSEKLCMALLKGETCPWGPKCRFSHDFKAYMATRPEDISQVEGGCPMFKLYGYCVYGATCRLGSCHISKTGENISNTTGGENLWEKEPGLSLLIPKDVQTQLRKKTFPFKCKRHFEKDTDKKDKTTEEPTKESTDDATPKDVDNTSKTQPSSSTPVELKTRKIVDFSNKVYVAPLTTVGNLPFRRVMKKFGADITCGEMAVGTCLLEGKQSEWALLKRHPEEDIFGIQIAAAHPDQFTRVSELIEQFAQPDFVDLNLGCPLDLVCDKGAGAALMMRERKLKGALQGITETLSCPVTIKMRTGWDINHPFAHQLVPKIQSWEIDGIAAIMVRTVS